MAEEYEENKKKSVSHENIAKEENTGNNTQKKSGEILEQEKQYNHIFEKGNDASAGPLPNFGNQKCTVQSDKNNSFKQDLSDNNHSMEFGKAVNQVQNQAQINTAINNEIMQSGMVRNHDLQANKADASDNVNKLINSQELANAIYNTNEMFAKITQHHAQATNPGNDLQNQKFGAFRAANTSNEQIDKSNDMHKHNKNHAINAQEQKKIPTFANSAYNNIKKSSNEYLRQGMNHPHSNMHDMNIDNERTTHPNPAFMPTDQMHYMGQNATGMRNSNTMEGAHLTQNTSIVREPNVMQSTNYGQSNNFEQTGTNPHPQNMMPNTTMSQNQNFIHGAAGPNRTHEKNHMQHVSQPHNNAMQTPNHTQVQNTNFMQRQGQIPNGMQHHSMMQGAPHHYKQQAMNTESSMQQNFNPNYGNIRNPNQHNQAQMMNQMPGNFFSPSNYNPNLRNMPNRMHFIPQNKQQYYNQQMQQNYMRQMYNQAYYNQMSQQIPNRPPQMPVNRNSQEMRNTNDVNNEAMQKMNRDEENTNKNVSPSHVSNLNPHTQYQTPNTNVGNQTITSPTLNNNDETNANYTYNPNDNPVTNHNIYTGDPNFQNAMPVQMYQNNILNTNLTDNGYNMHHYQSNEMQENPNIFDMKTFNHPDPYQEYIHAPPHPQKIIKKHKKTHEDEDSTSSTTTTEDSSESVSSSSTGEEEEEMPKKRGRPRKTTQEISYQMPQMPYNPNIHPPIGNQYQPSFRPMMYKPMHPFNPTIPRHPGDYRTKHMRNVSGPNASSYNAIFNMQMHKPGFYPPNVHPQQMVYHPGMYQNNAKPQDSSVYGYRAPNVGRPKSVHKRELASPLMVRKKRKSAVQNLVKKIEVEEEVTEETNEEEQDPIEKLLAKREDDYFFVKFRHKSYLHCDWVHKDEIGQTKGGLIKVKRFRPKDEPFDPDFMKVEKVYHEDYEDVEVEQGTENAFTTDGKFYIKKKIYLIKWRKMPHELSTFEYDDKVKELIGFKEEYQKMIERKKLKIRKYPIEWRPQRDQFIRFNTSPTFKNNNTLRAYQLEGLNWLLNRWFYKQGCIMADEMGLGKTVQSVTFVNTLFTRYECGPVLIVAPLSTIPHWEREFEAWSDLRVTTYHGSIQGREIIYAYEMICREDRNNYLFDVLITTYEMVMSGQRHLEGIKFSVGIFDEAHRLKNSNSKAVQSLKNIYFNHKVLLSGTPLQNNLLELWALLNFIDPMRYSSAQFFLEEYKLEKSEDVERLQNLLKPLMLRRMKDDVEKSIPLKEETIIEVELTMIQKKFYRAILEKNLEFLKRGEKAPNLGNVMVELRKCCIHPYLITGAEEKIIGEYKEKQRRNERNYIEERSIEEKITKSERNYSQERSIEEKSMEEDGKNTSDEEADNTNELVNETDDDIIIEDPVEIVVKKKIDFNFFGLTYDEYYKVLIQSSGKLVLLDKLLNKLKGKHKVLIFSQMTTCLNLLSEYLVFRNYKYERIDGGVRADHRQAAIDRFSAVDSDIFVFLLCTRAGGVGINLTAADTVVIFDSDWNPQNDLQAQARCHRIGQKNEVKIYRLVTRNSYEREMFDKAGLKLGLDRAVLQKMSFEGDKKMKKNAAIELLLKKGAYGVLMENDDVNSKFCEEDIDSILERRTKIVKHLESGNIFSKASFQVDEEVDDPHFWENLLSKKKSEADEGKIKRQVRRLARACKIDSDEVDRLIERAEKELEDYEDAKMYRKEVKKLEDDKESSADSKSGVKVNTADRLESKELVKEGDYSLVNPLKTTESISSHATASATESINSNVTVGTTTSLNEYSSDKRSFEYTEKLSLLVFLTVLKKGTHALQTLKNTKNTHKILSSVVKFCVDKIESKQKEDFLLHIDHLLKEPFEKEVFKKYSGLYEKYHEVFLLRLQIVLILTYLTKKSEIGMVERGKGFNYEDDKRIVNWVMTYGYDNFPSSTGREKGAFKGKSSNELNQRLRKIVLGLNRKNDDEEEELIKEDIERECLFLFGRVCDDNRNNVIKWFKEKCTDDREYEDFEKNLNEIVDNVTGGKKKRGGSEIGLHKRIMLFDNLRKIDELPVIKKSNGLTRKWNHENDGELRDFVVVNGLKDEIMGIGMDAAIKRLQLLVESETEKN